ncbi:helix-turn-helix transcriptional regulator [Marinococcus sp. PL1-022]|uniref:helix-turn-helix transcriptional regulator n=1 Tax=Marinococcus sp. PL1-022 TaxID=3095363 RepID=UPI0029C2EF5C|nr:helix-turn-helix transcriptional regulator [Marinococcus sp. PL1-022]MDX6154519.1 helix-turn-helix transcriptional regulator [Marinococcus sp. PL1-022]
MNVGEQLRHLREHHDMSREELAQEMNVSRQAVYKWETNKGYPDIDNLIRLSELYEFTLDELIKVDPAFQKKIAIDEQNDLSDPGFYLGAILVLIGIFLDFGTFSYALTIFGLLTMCFYEEFKKMFWRIKRDFQEEK